MESFGDLPPGQSELLSEALCLCSSSDWPLWPQLFAFSGDSPPILSLLALSGTGPARIRAGGAAQADRAIPRPAAAPGQDHLPAEAPAGGPGPHPGRALQRVHGV